MGQAAVKGALVLAFAAMFAMWFAPLLLRPLHVKNASLVGIDLQPIRAARVLLPNGATIVTDNHGKFDLPRQFVDAQSIGGFQLISRMHHTGSGPGLTFVFSTVADYIVSSNSQPMFSSAPKRLQLRIGSLHPKVVNLGVGESMRIRRVPAGVPVRDLIVRVIDRGPWKLGQLKRRVEGGVVRIDIPVSYQGPLD